MVIRAVALVTKVSEILIVPMNSKNTDVVKLSRNSRKASVHDGF